MIRKIILALLLVACTARTAVPQGINSTSEPIVFGQSAVFSGSAADLGINVRNGLQTAFYEINNSTGAGVNGRLLQLVSLDDMYDAAPALANAQTLIGENVMALVGTVGTPTAEAILPYSNGLGVPLIGPFTGARALRTPFQPYVINVRAGYDDELAAFVSYALGLQKTLFSIFYQNDSFGEAGLTALQTALSNQGLSILANATYDRTTLDVAPGFAIIESYPVKPDVIVMIGTAVPLANFVNLARKNSNFTDVIFMTVSFVGSEVFAQNLGGNTTNVIVTQVFPPPRSLDQIGGSSATASSFTTSSPLLTNFAAAMQNHCSGCGATFGALEGYIVGRFIIDVLQRMGPITASSLMQYASSGNTYTDLSSNITSINSALTSGTFSINNTQTTALIRDMMLFTIYDTSIFHIGGLTIGPYVSNTQCIFSNTTLTAAGFPISTYNGNCLSVNAAPCNQGQHSVYVTYINETLSSTLPNGAPTSSIAGLNTSALGIYQEDVPARYSWQVCNINSQLVSASSGALPIVFGQTAVLSGPSADLGIQVRRGILAAFKAVNLSPTSGIGGRKLILMSYDDEYNPDQAVANVQNMVNGQNITAVVGSVGTPTTTAVLATGLLDNDNLSLIGTVSGARALRFPFVRSIVNLRASYDDEVAAQLNYLVGTLKLSKISILMQNDAFGAAGLQSLELALAYHNLTLFSSGSYVRNTVDISAGLTAIGTAGAPQAIIMFGVANALAAFVSAAETQSPFQNANVVYLTVSFVGTEAYIAALPSNIVSSGRILITEVVPPPSATPTAQDLAAYPILSSYLEAMQVLDDGQSTTFGSLEGFLVGRLLTDMLVRSASTTFSTLSFNSSDIVNALYSEQSVNLDGFLLGPYVDTTELNAVNSVACNTGSHVVYMISAANPTTVLNTFTAGAVGECGVYVPYEQAIGNYTAPPTVSTALGPKSLHQSPVGLLSTNTARLLKRIVPSQNH